MTGPVRLFPSGLVGGDGRRVRLGSYVETIDDGSREAGGGGRRGEVTGWAGPRRGVEVFFHDTDTVETIHASALLRVDEEQSNPVTVGWFSIDDDDRPTLLVVPVGTRDLVVASNDPGPFAAIERSDVRAWVAKVAEVLHPLERAVQAQAIADHLDAPMLRRVLDEATLPGVVHRLMFVATDQIQPQPSDTSGLIPLLTLWLEGRGHLDLAGNYRPIEQIAAPGIITRLPHVLDAVVHQVSPAVASAGEECRRAVVSFAGGTPAMMYGCSIATARLFGAGNTRVVQIPQGFEREGERVEQPLIELDLADTALGDSP